jgi:hypothetical protein
MDWVPGVIVALIGVAGVLIGQVISTRAADKASERDWLRRESIREKEWKREERRRWDEQRLRAYADVSLATTKLIEVLGLAAPFWERTERLPTRLLQSWEEQREEVGRVHMVASMLASRPVRVELRRLWATTLKVGAALDSPSDGTESAAEMTHRLGNEIGAQIGEFRLTVANELGIDDGAEHA